MNGPIPFNAKKPADEKSAGSAEKIYAFYISRSANPDSWIVMLPNNGGPAFLRAVEVSSHEAGMDAETPEGEHFLNTMAL